MICLLYFYFSTTEYIIIAFTHILPNVVIVGDGDVSGHVADLVDGDGGDVPHLHQPGLPPLPGLGVGGPAPPIVPGGGVVVEDVGLVVVQVVGGVEVVGGGVGPGGGGGVAEGRGGDE